MFDWLKHLQRHRPTDHEPEVKQAQDEQRRRFDAWEVTMAEVNRVQHLAERAHGDTHRSRRRHR